MSPARSPASSGAQKTVAPKKSASLLMVFDGHSMAYRAFHALPDTMTTSSGQMTNMIVGFLNTFFKLYREYQPSKLAVCFDLPEPTFRHKQYKEYKANRPPSPEPFRQQMGLLHEILSALGVPVVEKSGYEADDVIASLASLGKKAKSSVLIVTGDRDCLQLVENPAVKVLYTPTKGEAVALDEAGVKEKVGVLPERYVQYAALKGDSSDNLPGIPGVGQKRAADLINAHTTVNALYKKIETIEKLSPGVKAALLEHREVAERNLDLMTLKKDVEMGVKFSDLQIKQLNSEKTSQLFSLLELNKFTEDLKTIWDFEAAGMAPQKPVGNFVRLKELSDGSKAQSSKALVDYLKSLGKNAAEKNIVALAENEDSDIFEGFALAVGGTAKTDKCDVVWIPYSQLKEKEVARALQQLDVLFIGHDIKPLLRELMGIQIELSNIKIDSRIAAYLLGFTEEQSKLENLLKRYAGLTLAEEGNSKSEAASKSKKDKEEANQLQLSEGNSPGNAPLRAAALLKTYKKMLEELSARKELELYETMEIPLISVLAKMEYIGIAVSRKELEALNVKFTEAAEQYRREVMNAAGKEFNVNSTKELSKVLFEDLELTPQKRTKQGFSTDASTLEKLKNEHPIISHILEYRGVEKLRSTYGQGLLNEIKSDGRIHATFKQTVARTGRLSSDAPNLHNIPIRTEHGREFRKVFKAEKGCELLVADYNQIELRCIAHLSADPNLIQAFVDGVDVHSSVAERVFGTPNPSRVLREQAKMVSYGLMYGMEAYGLSQRLNIDKKQAQSILDSFFGAYPSIKKYMEKTVKTSRELGYTETLFGRRRYIQGLDSDNFQVRAAAERQAMNSGIQGLAADIFKYALIGIHQELKSQKMLSRLVLQVHDEVILEVAKDEKDKAADIVIQKMENAASLDVPLIVDLTFGKTWADAKK